MFNELYYIAEGGSVWVDKEINENAQGAQKDDEKSESEGKTQDEQESEKEEVEAENEGASNGDSIDDGNPDTNEESEEEQNEKDEYLDEEDEAEAETEGETKFRVQEAPPREFSEAELGEVASKLQEPQPVEVQGEVAIAHDASIGKFLYLEGHEYLMYNTYDVHVIPPILFLL